MNEDRILGAIEKLSENQTRIFDSIDNLSENQTRIFDSIDKLTGEVKSLHQRMDRLEERMDQLEDTFETRVGHLEERMDRFEESLNRMDNRMFLQQEEITGINKKLESLNTQTHENVRFISAILEGQLHMEELVKDNHKEVCGRIDSLEADFVEWKQITKQHSYEIMALKKAQ